MWEKLVSRYEELQRRYRDALHAEYRMRSRKKAVKGWQRAGWIAQITLFFVGIAIGELLLWLF